MQPPWESPYSHFCRLPALYNIGVNSDAEMRACGRRMRQDWDRRALEDARRAVYTRDSETDLAGFDESGRANYDQLVRPFLPVLLEGRSPADCRVVEIGCGLGRMTQWFAREFAAVDALDVSPVMLEQGRARLAAFLNVAWRLGSGYDLQPIPGASCDLVFSYIVFQHVPSRAAIEGYVREAARVLKPRGAFKFQLNGDQSPEYRAHARDTWLGETFSLDEAAAMLEAAGFSLLAAEGAGTQYFVLTARKGREPRAAGLRCYILPGERWASAQLLEGWGEPVEESWRPVAARSRALLTVPPGCARFFLGFYIWPEEPARQHRVTVTIGGAYAGSALWGGAGDHYLELAAAPRGDLTEVCVTLEPEPLRAPAARCLGFA